MADKRIAVLGCGIVGLNTALRLQEDFPRAQITLMGEKLGQDIVSNVAAGIFVPSKSIRGPDEETSWQWIQDSWHYYEHIRLNQPCKDTGVNLVSLYMMNSSGIPNYGTELMSKLSPSTREMTSRELGLFMPKGKYQNGIFTTTMVITTDFYIPWAMKQFKGKIIRKKIESWHQLDAYDLVINCTGLGSLKICQDHALTPIRGQVIKVKAPWIKMAVYADNDTYIIPGF